MNVLLISGIALSFVFSAFIFFKKKDKKIADNILAIWLIFLGLDFLRSYLVFHENIMFLLGFGYTMPAINAPFIFIYVYTLASPKTRFNTKLLYHLIPFLLFNLYLLFFIYIKSPEFKQSFFQETTFLTRPVLFNFFELIMIIIVPVYIIWVLKLLKKHLINITNRFSCKEKIDLKWINYLLVSSFALWLVASAIKFTSGYFDTLYYNDTLLLILYFELIIIVIIGYFGFHQDVIFFNLNEPELQIKTVKKYSSTGLSDERSRAMAAKVLAYMKTEKPYLISDISIDKLAEMLDLSSHHLSQIINEQLGKNFFEFINEYRVEEVKQQIARNRGEKYTLLSIAYDSGFNSKSTFNSTFKKYTKLTPKQYMNTNA